MSVESPASHFYSSPWAVGSVKSSQSSQSSQTRPRSVSEAAEGPPLKKPKIEGRISHPPTIYTLHMYLDWSSVSTEQ